MTGIASMINPIVKRIDSPAAHEMTSFRAKRKQVFFFEETQAFLASTGRQKYEEEVAML